MESFFKKLITWMKILVQTRETRNQPTTQLNSKVSVDIDLVINGKTVTRGQGEILEVKSSIGYQNSAKLGLVWANDAEVRATHP